MQLWGTVGLLRRVCGRSLPGLFGVIGALFGGLGSTLGVTFSAPQRGSLARLGWPGGSWRLLVAPGGSWRPLGTPKDEAKSQYLYGGQRPPNGRATGPANLTVSPNTHGGPLPPHSTRPQFREPRKTSSFGKKVRSPVSLGSYIA